MIPPAFSRLLSLFSFRGDREAGLRMLWSATAYKSNINGGTQSLRSVCACIWSALSMSVKPRDAFSCAHSGDVELIGLFDRYCALRFTTFPLNHVVLADYVYLQAWLR